MTPYATHTAADPAALAGSAGVDELAEGLAAVSIGDSGGGSCAGAAATSVVGVSATAATAVGVGGGAATETSCSGRDAIPGAADTTLDSAPSAAPVAAAAPSAAGQPAGRLAGLDDALQAMRELVGWPSTYAEEGQVLGVRWPRGLLLHGPPGCGKTLLVQAVAEEFGASLHVVTASSVLGAFVGESERHLREAFEAARKDADAGRTAVIFLDEVDALCPRRDGKRQHEARVVAQLLTLLDGAGTATPAPLLSSAGLPSAGTMQMAAPRRVGHVAVVAATNRPNALDPALRRPGRLDREVMVAVPGPQQRASILRLHTRSLPLAPDVDLEAVAAGCHGYSGADLAALAREAAMQALSAAVSAAPAATGFGLLAAGQFDDVDTVPAVTTADFAAARRRVGPSIVRGAEAEVVPVAWDDVGGLEGVKRRLRQAVEWPLHHADAFQRLGLSAPRGVLLHGPPGCCKTTLASAVATGSGATLLPLSCAQLYSMYVGDGEALLRDTFKRARMASPAIIFLDEVDAVAARRGEGGSDEGGGGTEASVRLLSTLLTEMDGMELATGVLVLAATNRPAAIDSALMRPGRFDVRLYVPPPDAPGRLHVLCIHTRRMPLAADVDLEALAQDTDRFTGAELAGLCREAAVAALREDVALASEVAARHFQAARAATAASLSADALHRYEHWGEAAPAKGA